MLLTRTIENKWTKESFSTKHSGRDLRGRQTKELLVYMDHKDLVCELMNPLAKTLDPARSHSCHLGWCHGEVAISTRARQDSCSFWHGVGRFYKQSWGSKLSYTRSTLLCSRNPKREVFDGSASILENGWIRFFPSEPLFVDRPAIFRDEIVVKFLFWLEFSRGLLCGLCWELGTVLTHFVRTYNSLQPVVPSFSLLNNSHKWSIHLICRSFKVTSAPKAWRLSIHLAAGCEIFYRTASSPTHGEWDSELSKAEGTGNSSPSASSPTHFVWSLVIGYMESHNGFVRMACFPIYPGERFAQPPTFFHHFSFYRRRIVLVRQMEASMPRCHIGHVFKMVMGSQGPFVCSSSNWNCLFSRELQQHEIWPVANGHPQYPIYNGWYMHMMMTDQRKLFKVFQSIRSRE